MKAPKLFVISLLFIYSLALPAQVYETFEPAGPHLSYWYANGTTNELSTPVANPSAAGINTSPTVGRYVKPAGTWIAFGGGISGNFNFSQQDTLMLMVYGSASGAVQMLIQDNADVTVPGGSVTANYSTPNAWQNLSFVFSGITATNAQRIVLFLDPADATAGKTIYIDNFRMPPPPASGSWNLVWSDEFNYTGLPNSANWTYEVGYIRNNELQYYTNARPENAYVQGGNLNIVGRKEPYGGMNYTSASIKTDGIRSWKYGKMESRMKLTRSQGYWPAFWMLGQNIGSVGWPACGEIDIMEHISKEDKTYGTMHWYNTAYTNSGYSTYCDMTQYHTYAIEWDAAQVKWFLDGVQFFQVSILNNVNNTQEFHLPHYILLNLAIGGAWPGAPDATTKFPDTMYVDYVRVYKQQSPASIKDQGLSPLAVSVYPNPAQSMITVSLPGDTRPGTVQLAICDMLGREMKTLYAEKNEFQLDVSEFPGGMYMIHVSSGEGRHTVAKFFKALE